MTVDMPQDRVDKDGTLTFLTHRVKDSAWTERSREQGNSEKKELELFEWKRTRL